MSTALLVGSMIGSIYSGISASMSAQDEAKDLKRQAALERQEGLEEAARLEKEHRKFLAKQSLMYLKGGVTLEGSPLLVLKETRDEKDKQVTAQERRAEALYRLGRGKAQRVSRGGRAGLIGGFMDAATTGAILFK